MAGNSDDLVPKVHPATRAVEPEDPLNLHGFEVPGNPDIMLRMLVEEFARLGYGLDGLMHLCRDPFYHALHGIWLQLGDEELRRRMGQIFARVGVLRVRTLSAPATEELIQIGGLK